MRRSQHRQTDSSEASRYCSVAEKLLETAQALHALGDDTYANALGIVAIHAAIAMCDALTIRIGGVKSTSGDHADAVDLLADTVADIPAEALRGFRRAIQAKNAYSYTGRLYHTNDAGALLASVETFFTWARTRLS